MKELREIQNLLKAPKSEKNRVVGFNYRSAESILSAARPLYIERGCMLILSDNLVPMANGAVFVEAVATITNKDGESVSAKAYAQQGQLHRGIDYPQLTGAASSYARKYALCGLFAIDDSSNDPDTDKNTKAREEAAKAEADERLAQAQQAALQCTTEAELLAVWNKYPDLQSNPQFTGICTQQKQAIRK